MNPLCKANIDVLTQLKELINFTSAIYSLDQIGEFSGIGKHVRHVLDHYCALQQGLVNSAVDYNRRNRNGREETNTKLALERIDDLIQWLTDVTVHEKEIAITSEISISQTLTLTTHSTVERELLYLINHSIHHMAYMAVIAKTKGIFIPKEIGLAPSTASFEKQRIGV